MASPGAVVTHGDGAFSSSYRESRPVGGTMLVLIGALIIVVGAFVLAEIMSLLIVCLSLLPSKFFFSQSVGIFVWLR